MAPEQLAALLRRSLRHYIPDSKLPGRDALAARFDVPPRVAAAALQLLADEGLIRVVPRRESVVLDPAARQGRPFRRVVALSPFIPRLNSFQQSILRGADRQCRARGLKLDDFAHDVDLSRADLLDAIAGQEDPTRIGWMFVNHIPPDQSLLHWRIRSIPLVLVDDRSPTQPTNSVCFDVQRVIYEATRTLMMLGHVRIGYAGDLRHQDAISTDRRRGFELALASGGLEARADWLFHDDSGTHEEPRRLLVREMPSHTELTALVAADVKIGSGAMQAAAELGIAVPDRLSIVAGGSTPREPLPLADRLSRFDQGSPELLGSAAVDVLANAFEHPEPVQIMLGANWLDVGSVGPPSGPIG
ncbi:MAG: HTH-type transcriptional repressor PurR [Phycisphaerae bacterium]|nr:HTH-type transcriptional repressor PurR [Phycisphaerae bacterium]